MEHRRRIATYVMALGLLAAAAMLGVGYAEFWVAAKRLATLQAKCTTPPRPPTIASIGPDLPSVPPDRQPVVVRDWFAKYDPDFSKLKPDAQARVVQDAIAKYGKRSTDLKPGEVEEPLTDKDFSDKDFVLVCDPETLGGLASGNLVGVQLEIQQEYTSSKKGWQDVKFWSLLVAVLFSIPRAWYFLLGRIAEISGAIRGS